MLTKTQSRFSAHHPILSSHWQLRIKNVSKRYRVGCDEEEEENGDDDDDHDDDGDDDNEDDDGGDVIRRRRMVVMKGKHDVTDSTN